VNVHPFADVFPLLGVEAIQALSADIRAHGLREPIRTYAGQILDGRNRYEACRLADVIPTFEVFDGTPDEALAFVWSKNFARRHLTRSQVAACIVKRETLVATIAAEAKHRQRDHGKTSPGRKADTQRTNALSISKSKTAEKLATIAGTSPRYVEYAQAIQNHAPAQLEAVARGEKTIPQVMRELRRADLRQRSPLPTGTFRVIYADPPWAYSNTGIVNEEKGAADPYGRAERFYPSMTVAELCAMDVVSHVADNAVMFLWVTSPLLADCWPVIKAWGFTYRASFIWDKVRHNFGHYNSVRHELLLVCTRGSCLPDHLTPMPDSVMSIHRGDVHSEKPAEFRAVIDRLYDGGEDQKLELFAREEVVGWTAWGNQVPGRAA
jgi:N6-adenosine-specific RNA methylase IME4